MSIDSHLATKNKAVTSVDIINVKYFCRHNCKSVLNCSCIIKNIMGPSHYSETLLNN